VTFYLAEDEDGLEKYDPYSGEYQTKPLKTLDMAVNVTFGGSITVLEEFGGSRLYDAVIRWSTPLPDRFDYVVIDDRKFVKYTKSVQSKGFALGLKEML
jgi:hypothetical protein